MALDVNNPYFRTKVLTASPEELRLMLLDGGLHFLRVGREAVTERRWETAYDNLSQAKAIVMELMNALRPEVAPELCGNLMSLYTYIYRLITEGSVGKDVVKLDEAKDLLEHDRETWRMLLDKLAEQRGAGTDAAAAPPPAPNGGPSVSGADRPSISLSA